MKKSKRLVVLGFLGSQLDKGGRSERWEKWRPTVALMQHEDLVVDRLEMFYTLPFRTLADSVSRDIAAVSPETTVVPRLLEIADAWDFEDVYAALFDFAKNYPFDPDTEEYWVHITTGTHVAQICLFLLTETRFFPGRLVQTSPPRRAGGNRAGAYTLIDLDLSRYDLLAQRFSHEHAEGIAFLKSGIATRNAAFNRMIEEIERVAIKSKAPLLLMGPTGAGKSFLARRVFELKKARHQLDGKFIEVNCATLRGDGAASTLFGHSKGAFTGAASARPGLLRSAHRGMLFLDEIGELGPDEQAMLLKAIEEKRFFPIGSDDEVQSDFQLIAGTNRDLSADVQAGRFREDLYARINLWSYALPGLAQRVEDIEPNLAYLLAQFSEENASKVRFNRESRARFMQFAASPAALWRGNFRDLSAAVTRMATLSESGVINDTVVDDEIARLQRLWRQYGHAPGASVGGGAGVAIDVELDALLGEEAAAQLDLFDAAQLRTVIAVCRSARSLSDAGRALFAVSRAAKAKPNDADRLKKYLARFDLDWEQVSMRSTAAG